MIDFYNFYSCGLDPKSTFHYLLINPIFLHESTTVLVILFGINIQILNIVIQL